MHRVEASAYAVVATDSASVDADCDNGAAVHGTPRRGRQDGDADRRLATAVEHTWRGPGLVILDTRGSSIVILSCVIVRSVVALGTKCDTRMPRSLYAPSSALTRFACGWYGVGHTAHREPGNMRGTVVGKQGRFRGSKHKRGGDLKA